LEGSRKRRGEPHLAEPLLLSATAEAGFELFGEDPDVPSRDRVAQVPAVVCRIAQHDLTVARG
jgi:hypothetical protein